MTRARLARGVGLALAVAGLAMSGAPPVSFNRPPHYIAENTPTPFELRIPRDAENRAVAVSVVDRADGERVSYTERPLDGGSAPLQVFKLILPRGDLLLVGALYGVHGPRGRVQTRVRVLSPYDRPEPDDLTGEGNDD